MSAALPAFERARAALLARGGAYASVDRDTAWSRFVASGLPGARSEPWKYTPVGALLDRPFQPAPVVAPGSFILPPSLPGAIRIVFVNGRFEPALGAPAVGSSGPVAIVSTLPSLPEPREEGLGALNHALFEQGALIDLPEGANGGRVELLHIVAGVPDGAMVHPRAFFRLGQGARLTVFERFVGITEAAYFVAPVTEVQLAEDARLSHCAMQAEGRRALHLGMVHVHQGARSQYDTHVVQMGGALSRREIGIRFAGEGAQASLDGLSVTGSGQHHDLHVQLDHASPACTSQQRFRGLLSGTGRGVFTGKVHVHPKAQKTDAAQSARCLLLSPDAEADLRPHLEIHADDVKASHGATVGELDPDQLFYLRARGIPEDTARALLTVAFAREVIDALPDAALREQVLAQLEAGRCASTMTGGAP
jgi:Fe-S cluster assembly protein SufD